MKKDADGQQVAFPDLDMAKPGDKALLAAAKSYARAKGSRDAVLSTEKEKVDAKMEHLVALMHKNNMTKFHHDGVSAEIIIGRERATVRLEGEDAEDSEPEE